MSLYFAYGSNLDHAQMRHRCPGAVRVARATMSGYRLAFTGYSRTWQGPVATIIPEPGALVEGVLYRLAPGELRVLDRYEGHPDVSPGIGQEFRRTRERRVWPIHGGQRALRAGPQGCGRVHQPPSCAAGARIGAWTGCDGCRACGFAQFQPQRWAVGAVSSRRARTISAEEAKKESEEGLSMVRRSA
jgi:hypothetical protein